MKVVKRAYARLAGVYDLTHESVLRRGRRQAVNVANKRVGRLLEVGVGTGSSLPHYRSDLEVTAIDFSPEMLKKARNRVVSQGLSNIKRLSVMDVMNLEFADSSFDIIVAAYVLAATGNARRALEEIERVLAPGGEVIIVSYFGGGGRIRSSLEQSAASFCMRAFGTRPNLSLATVVSSTVLTTRDIRSVGPLGMFTLVHLAE